MYPGKVGEIEGRNPISPLRLYLETCGSDEYTLPPDVSRIQASSRLYENSSAMPCWDMGLQNLDLIHRGHTLILSNGIKLSCLCFCA